MSHIACKELKQLKAPELSPEDVLTPDALLLKKYKSQIKELKAGEIDAHMKLEDKMLALTKKIAKDSKITKGTLRGQAVFQGLTGIGGAGTAYGLLNSSDHSKYNTLKHQLENEKEGELNKNATLTGALAVGALGHMVQNGLFNYFSKTKKGREAAGKFLTDRFTEGYKGKAVRGKLNKKLTSIETAINPLNLFRSKKEAVAAARKGVDRMTGYGTGVAYHLMPEAETMAKELRHMGKNIKDAGINLKDLTPTELKGLSHVADGNLHQGLELLSKSPTAIQIVKTMFPSVKNLSINQVGSGLSRVSKKGANAKEVELLNKQFKSTNIQPILQAAKDTIEKQKGLARTGVGSESLAKNVKRENVGYNISHAGLTNFEPGAAFLNGLKRALSMERLAVKDGDPLVVKKLKNVANTTNMALNAGFMKLPTLKAKVKGLAGMEYKETRGTKLNQIFGSPAIQDTVEDSQRLAHILSSLGKHKIPKIKGEIVDNPLMDQVKGLADTSKKKLNRYSGLKGVGRMVKDTNKFISDAGKEGSGKQSFAKNVLKSLSPIESMREEGKEGLRAVGKKVARKATKKATEKLKNADKAYAMLSDEASDIENKYNRWALPGTALGATALASPMIKDMYDRNRQSKDTTSPILHGKQVA